MHKRDIARQAYSVAVWDALKEIAERHEIKKKKIGACNIGQHVVCVILNDDGTNSVLAGRCSWYSVRRHDILGRILTDVTSFIWLEDAVDPLNAVQTYDALWIPASRPTFACDTDRQARALAALASEGGELPNIERMIDHER